MSNHIKLTRFLLKEEEFSFRIFLKDWSDIELQHILNKESLLLRRCEDGDL